MFLNFALRTTHLENMTRLIFLKLVEPETKSISGLWSFHHCLNCDFL